MNKELLKTIGIYSAIGLGSIAAIGITVAVIRKKQFSGKGKGSGTDAGVFGANDPVGKTLSTTGATAYLRSTPEIPNNLAGQCAWYDVICLADYATADTMTNVVGTLKGGSGDAVIKKVVVGKDGWNWYYLEGVSTSGNVAWGNVSQKKNGYVREDVVKVNFK